MRKEVLMNNKNELVNKLIEDEGLKLHLKKTVGKASILKAIRDDDEEEIEYLTMLSMIYTFQKENGLVITD